MPQQVPFLEPEQVQSSLTTTGWEARQSAAYLVAEQAMLSVLSDRLAKVFGKPITYPTTPVVTSSHGCFFCVQSGPVGLWERP